MKKLAVLVAVVSIAALAAPALAATNPFMDVPMNHWAYDAIGQLAAHGILSGYPDGLYKGKQQTTRYEMASALARALAVVDMTKASKQDVEMLKRLVVEFKDELEALGVKVAELDERVAVLEDRLGGWHIHGDLALDVKYQKTNDVDNTTKAEGQTSFTFDDSKLYVERWFGEDDEYFFRARFNGGDNGDQAYFDRFYVEMPFFLDTRLTVGRFNWALEGEYRPKANLGKYVTGSFGEGQHLMTDWTWNGFGLTKNFALGTVGAVVAHPNQILDSAGKRVMRKYWDDTDDGNWSDWMLMLYGQFQFTEQFGLDLGGVYFKGDKAEEYYDHTDVNGNPTRLGDIAFDKMWEVYAGLRFNFNENVAFKGVFYHQKWENEYVALNNGQQYWERYSQKTKDDPNHWAVMFDVKQEALKYTSLWLEYGQFDQGFVTRGDKGIDTSGAIFKGIASDKIKYWRIALGQEWNEKWATHLFYYGYKVDGNGKDWKPSEIGVGVQYKLNDYTTMGLNYVHVKDAVEKNGDYEKDNIIRFRTAISF